MPSPSPASRHSTGGRERLDTAGRGSVEGGDTLPLPRLTFSVAAAAVFCLAVLCFANSYDGDFVFDDSEAILNNKDLEPETPLSDVFQHDFWGRKLNSKTSHKSYRPLTVVTFRWNYFLAGGLHPLGFHAANILLHGAVCVLFLLVFAVLFSGSSAVLTGSLLSSPCPRPALLCATLFAIHPIHTESVAAVVGRADLLCAATFLLSFLCYARSCHDSAGELYRPRSTSLSWLLCSMVLSAISTFCKEQGITVIGLCSAYDVIMVCRVDLLEVLRLQRRKAALQNGHNNNHLDKEAADSRDWVQQLVKRHLVLLASAIAILVVRFQAMGSTPPVFQVHDNPHSFVNGTFLRGLNYGYLYAINAWLLLNPWWLCFDWSMGCVPVIQSLADPRNLASLLLLAAMLSLLSAALLPSQQLQHRVLALALAFLVVPFLPASNLFFRVGFVVAERNLYLSSAGFCILVTLGAQLACCQHRAMVKWFLVFLHVIFIVRSVQRSNEWRREVDLFSAGEKVCPLNAKVHYNIAKLAGDSGNASLAVERYRLAISLNPEYDQAMNNLANILKDDGLAEEAEQLLLRAVSIRADFAAAWMNLGIAQAQLKKTELAEQSYLEALRHRRKYPDCFYNLGNLYVDTGRPERALEAWRNATLQKPTHVSAWSNMLILLDSQERFKEVVALGREALKVLPNQPNILFNLANTHGKMENYQDSEAFFLRAISLEKSDPKLHLNLGVLYHRWNKAEKAEAAYKQALKLDPVLPSARENLEMLYRKMGKKSQN